MAMLGEKVLVIGDEGLAQRVASLEPGYQVKLTPQERVLEVAQQEPFDLVIAGQDNLPIIKALIKRYSYLGALLLGEGREPPPHGCLTFPALLSDEELIAALEEALEKRRLLRENRHLQALLPLFEVNRALFSDTDLDTLPHTLLQIVWSEVRADKAALFLWEGEGPVLRAQIGGNELSPDMAMRAAEGRQPLHVSPDGTGSLLCLPLIARGKVIAILQASRASAFSPRELSFLTILEEGEEVKVIHERYQRKEVSEVPEWNYVEARASLDLAEARVGAVLDICQQLRTRPGIPQEVDKEVVIAINSLEVAKHRLGLAIVTVNRGLPPEPEAPSGAVAKATPAPQEAPGKAGGAEYYLADGRGPYAKVQEAMDALGVAADKRPKHNRWDRLSATWKTAIIRREGRERGTGGGEDLFGGYLYHF